MKKHIERNLMSFGVHAYDVLHRMFNGDLREPLNPKRDSVLFKADEKSSKRTEDKETPARHYVVAMFLSESDKESHVVESLFGEIYLSATSAAADIVRRYKRTVTKCTPHFRVYLDFKYAENASDRDFYAIDTSTLEVIKL